jgi:hypothetical protein
MCSAVGHVRFTPDSDIDRAFRDVRFWAKSGHQLRQKETDSRSRTLQLPAVFAEAARSASIMKSRVIGTASRLVESSN